MKKYIVEFIGTYFLVLTIGCTIIGGLGSLAPIAIGFGLMVMVYAGGHISGAHYNPAITIAICLRGFCAWSEAPGYMIGQMLGTVLATSTVTYLVGSATMVSLETGPTLLSEIIGTFILAFVILNVATSKNTEGNSFYGIAIGGSVTALAYVFGGISGGAFNPAVAIGFAIMGMVSFADIWMHIVASIIGASFATFVFLYLNSKN